MEKPRRLTLDESLAFPYAWTPDSKGVLFSSDRTGSFGIFREALDRDSADSLVVGPENYFYPEASPDGSWVVYKAVPKPPFDYNTATMRLMRIPISGGPPELILSTRRLRGNGCSRPPANLCVFAEATQDGKQLVFTSFDPLQGRGRELMRVEASTSDSWDLSPDGTRIAILRRSPTEGRIRLIRLADGKSTYLKVNGWVNLAPGQRWSADGKGIFVVSQSPSSNALLYVDLGGRARVLWEQHGTNGVSWAIPSPDGRYLALSGQSVESNAWMIEHFQ